MRAFVPTPEIESSKPELRGGISLRAISAIEVASVIASVFLTTWVIIPLQLQQRWLTAVPPMLAVVLMLNSHRVRGENLGELGFTTRGFGRTLRLVSLPTLLACGLFAGIGWWNDSFHQTSHFWANLAVVPVWGLIQQYVLQSFIYRRMRFAIQNAHWATLATAVIFATTHAPNLTLMVLTFLGALIWSWVYERAPNLFALALSHAAISLMLMTALPSWLLESMSVGYKHFLYQKF